MKSMILVLSPEEAAKLLNGDLSVLVRKKFPKDFTGWINVYVKKDKKNKLVQSWDTDDCGYGHYFMEAQVYKLYKPKKPKTPEPTGVIEPEELPDDWEFYYIESDWCDYVKENNDNGKIVARFWCNKIEEIIDKETKEKNHYSFGTETLQIDELEKMSCLNIQELCKYIGKGTKWQYGDYGYAINISKLEIFDKPKELTEFINWKYAWVLRCGSWVVNKDSIKLTKAPTRWCYVEE